MTKKKPNKSSVKKERSLEFKEDGESYAKIIKINGNRRFDCILDDGGQRLAILPGRFRRFQRVNLGDFVLVSIRDFEKDKVDILLVYRPEEVRMMIAYGEIPSGFVTTAENDSEEEVIFGEDDGCDEDIDIDGI
tara:strand:- start:48 stop:449 length:402 start_codon:yes stop_codon:yes gene_type:complete